MRRFLKFCCMFILVCFIVPLLARAAYTYTEEWPNSWRDARWTSSQTAPHPQSHPEALVRIYAARTGRWKSVFADHYWIVTKGKNDSSYTRYDVVGWGKPVRRNAYAADAFWYSNEPRIMHEVKGKSAELLIPQIEKAVDAYKWDYYGSYIVWPGPNSNTFVAHVLRSVPDLKAELMSTAVGKDYLGPGLQFASTPSGTGWQFSFHGLIGIAGAWREGVEFQILGATFGLDFEELALKLPGWGNVGLSTISEALTGPDVSA